MGKGELAQTTLICGLDPGLQRTGYGIIEASRTTAKLIDAGLITTNGRDALPQRIDRIYNELLALFDEYPRLSVTAVEQLYSHYRHPRTAVMMAHARGAMLLAATARGIDIVDIAATMVKKALTGSGRAGKIQIQRAVLARLSISSARQIPADVTDALALAICCAEHMHSRDA